VFFVRLPSPHAQPHIHTQPHSNTHDSNLYRHGTPRLLARADLAGALRRGVQSSRRRHRPCRPAAAAMAPDHLQLACCRCCWWCYVCGHAPARTPRPTTPPYSGLARHLARQFLLPAPGPQRHLFRRGPQDDATQMSFQIAMVEMNPAAFHAVVRQHKQRRRQQLQREEREKQRLRRVQQRREERDQRAPSAPAHDESSSLLLPPNPSFSLSVSSFVASSGPLGTHPAANVDIFFILFPSLSYVMDKA
jgi:hypothetical protein